MKIRSTGTPYLRKSKTTENTEPTGSRNTIHESCTISTKSQLADIGVLNMSMAPISTFKFNGTGTAAAQGCGSLQALSFTILGLTTTH